MWAKKTWNKQVPSEVWKEVTIYWNRWSYLETDGSKQTSKGAGQASKEKLSCSVKGTNDPFLQLHLVSFNRTLLWCFLVLRTPGEILRNKSYNCRCDLELLRLQEVFSSKELGNSLEENKSALTQATGQTGRTTGKSNQRCQKII